MRELERTRKISPYKLEIFQQLMRLRNKSVHHPRSISEEDFEEVMKALKILEGDF